MIDIEKIKILPTLTIEKSMIAINSGALKIALVVNHDDKLLGTLSDGDVRRGILDKKDLNSTIEDIYSKNSIIAKPGSSKEELLNLCSKNRITQVPIVDDSNKVVDLFILEDSLSIKQHNNHVILMVGGLGTRLRPLTKNIPKPMLNVGGQPILDTIVKGFVDKGFANITMCVGYKSNIIQDYFKDGSDFNANIDYVLEDKRMGTAGALTLLNKKPSEPFFVMNGDLLTNVDYSNILDFHKSINSKATMCVREYDFQVPYGVVKMNNENIISIEEKPIHSFFVNAGIYLIDPECIDLIPKNEFYDMTSLFEAMLANNKKTTSFPLKEYWLDIGRIGDYEKANREFVKFL